MLFASLPRRLGLACLLISGAWLTACSNKPITAEAPPPRLDQPVIDLAATDTPENMLDWAGTYQAVLPCHGCTGIAISVQLRSNKTAEVRERRMGGNLDAAIAPTYAGAFAFDPPGGSMITMRAALHEEPVYRFFVAEDWIEMRHRHTGHMLSPTSIYRLRKISSTGQ